MKFVREHTGEETGENVYNWIKSIRGKAPQDDRSGKAGRGGRNSGATAAEAETTAKNEGDPTCPND